MFVFKQKKAYKMRISDWSSDVCSSDRLVAVAAAMTAMVVPAVVLPTGVVMTLEVPVAFEDVVLAVVAVVPAVGEEAAGPGRTAGGGKTAKQQRGDGEKDDGKLAHGSITRSEEHTSELQSLMRISYAVFCLKKKIIRNK